MSAERAQQLLFQYGHAIRGDWSMMDGRSVQDDLEYIGMLITEIGDEAPILYDRDQLGLCPAGEGHWYYNCDQHCEETR